MSDFEIAVERLTDWLQRHENAGPRAFMGDLTLVLLVAKKVWETEQQLAKYHCEKCGGLTFTLDTKVCGCGVTGTIDTSIDWTNGVTIATSLDDEKGGQDERVFNAGNIAQRWTRTIR